MTKVAARIVELETEAYMLAEQPFNLASDTQVAEILFTKLGLPVVKINSSGGTVIDDEVLKHLALDYRLPCILFNYRQLVRRPWKRLLGTML